MNITIHIADVHALRYLHGIVNMNISEKFPIRKSVFLSMVKGISGSPDNFQDAIWQLSQELAHSDM